MTFLAMIMASYALAMGALLLMRWRRPASSARRPLSPSEVDAWAERALAATAPRRSGERLKRHH